MSCFYHNKLILALALILAALLSSTEKSSAIFGRTLKKSKIKRSTSPGEFIIVSGGTALRKWENLRKEKYQHDRWWGNFIRPARARIQELQNEYGNQCEITWLVYKPSYESRSNEDNKPLISWIESVRDKYKIRLLWITEGKDIINYINNGKDRSQIKIAGFEYYGHSNRHAFLIDYSNRIIGVSTVWLHEEELTEINRFSFLRRSKCVSYGCNTGESMSKKWRKATGVSMRAAIGKTDYTNPLKPTVVAPGYWNDSKSIFKRKK
ncbi:MAG: hypothetical protein ACJ0K4_14310 [Verrucomicrobiales bacterium]